MDRDRLVVPPLVRARAAAAGAVGRRWLDELPAVLDRLADSWQLRLGTAYTGGTASYVTAALDATGRDVVVKVAMPLDDAEVAAFRQAVVVHRLADGRGCVRLLAADEAAPAMLLERLGPNLHEQGLALPDVFDVVAATLRSFWRPADRSVPLPTGVDTASRLAEQIRVTWAQLGRPCARDVIDRALRCCDERAAAFDWDDAVLVHGDAHGWNTVAGGPGGAAFVDPEGAWSHREHDLGVPMREYDEPLLAGDTSRLVRQRAELLAGACDADPEAVWQWGFVERVSTGLLDLRDFGGHDGAKLEVAARSR